MPRSAPLRARRSRQVTASAWRAALNPVAVRRLSDWRPPAGGVGEAWQREAYGYVDVIGELGYVVNLTANAVAQARVTPAVWVPEDRAFVPTDDPRVLRVWQGFCGPRGGQAELFRRAALHLLVAGECFLLGSRSTDREPLFEWEFVSVDEIRVEQGGRVKRNAAGRASDADFVPVDAYIARLWSSDPRFSERATSPLKRNLPICREIVVLTQVVDAIAKSRLSAGILFVPEEMSFGPEDERENPGGDVDDIDEFTEELLEHLQAPVDDRTSAASLVPLVIRGAAELGREIRLIEVARDLDRLYMELRQEAIGRLGAGLDIPPEVMSGKAGLNHWTGYNVDADFVQKHVVPLGEQIASFVTEAYLRPALAEFERVGSDDARRFGLIFDPAPLLKRADAGPAARAAFDRFELSGEALRRENGFGEADAPSEEERARRAMMELLLRRPVELAPVLLPRLFPGEDWGELPVVAPAAGVGGSPGLVGRRDDPVPDLETGQDEPTPRESAAGLVDRLATAADAALERALERAANRVLSRLNGTDSELRAGLRSMRLVDVVSAVPGEVLARIGESPVTLLDGAWESLREKTVRWVRGYLLERGVTGFVADEQAEVVAEKLVEVLDRFAVAAFDAPLRAGVNGLRVPHELVEVVLVGAGVVLPGRVL